MRTSTWLLSFLVLSVVLVSQTRRTWAAEGVISKVVAIPEQNYCHLKFPAIRPDTLYTNRPVLQDPHSGDIVDFYGPCDYDPLSKEQVQRQKDDIRRARGQVSD